MCSSAPASVTPRPALGRWSFDQRRFRWELVALLWFAYFLNQGDRQLYNVLLPLIKSDLHLSDVQLGLVATTFTIAFALFVPMAGVAGDLLPTRWVVCGSLLFWSAATLLTNFSAGLIQLVIFRGLATGGGEAFYYPAANSLLSEYHSRTRATAMAIHQTALYAGVVASGFGAGWLGEHFGWRSTFLVFGGCGIIWSAVLALRVRRAPVQAGCSAEPGSHDWGAAKQIFCRRTVWALTLTFGCTVFVSGGYVAWMPTYLHEHFGFTLAHAGFSAVFYHHLFAAAGVLLGGRLSDRLAPARPTIRIEMELAALLCGAPFVAMMGWATNPGICYLAMAGFGFFRGLYDANLLAALFDLVEPRYRATAAGLMISCAFLLGSGSPLLLGWAKGVYGLAGGFVSLGTVYLIASLPLMLALLRWFPSEFRRPADSGA